MPYRDPVAALEIKLRGLREARRELDGSIDQTRRELARHRRPRRQRWVSMVAAAIAMTVVVVACLGAAVVPMIGRGCRADSAHTTTRVIRGAAQLYVARNSDCPSVEALIADGLLDPDMKTDDAWDNPFRIECVALRIIVHSAGPDGEHGTLDDISAPPPNQLLSEPRALDRQPARDGGGLACFGR